MVKIQFTSANIQMTLDIIEWVLTFSIISHDSILEEVMLISLEKAVVVWVSPAAPQQIFFI